MIVKYEMDSIKIEAENFFESAYLDYLIIQADKLEIVGEKRRVVSGAPDFPGADNQIGTCYMEEAKLIIKKKEKK